MAAETFDRCILKVMVATCSLAAGINLPARRVVLIGARMGRELVGSAILRHMRGRVCRKGKDEIGKTCLCCQKPYSGVYVKKKVFSSPPLPIFLSHNYVLIRDICL
jgi:replicative superfamily II helicase